MKYLLLKLDEEKYWFELDDDKYATRQIILDKYNKFHFSCFEDCLAEGLIDETDIEGISINLKKQDFESIWASVLKQYEKQWLEIKTRYPIGTFVQGVNSYFYPQGAIIKGKSFTAIYKGEEPFCLNKTVQYKVKSYDEINMWLVVE